MTKPLRTWRAEQLLSTRRLAAEAGTSNKTIVQIENGRQTPTFATMAKISRVLEVEPREVREFALALAERARESLDALPGTRTPAVTHVVCVSAVPSFLNIARRLLAEERYAVTSMIGGAVTADQIGCLQPDLLILDLGVETQHALDLLRQLRGIPATRDVPIVGTSRDRRRLEERLAGLGEAGEPSVTLVPFDQDLRALLATVAALTDGIDGEDDATHA
jgi:transcriptional regulator with XRE-family HTH domain